MNEHVGVIHVHSVFSDGTGDLQDLVNPAMEVGLDYLVLTDHMTLKARENGWQKYHRNLLLIVGYEHQDRHGKNHYLVLGGSNNLLSVNDPPQTYIQKAQQDGCAGFIAHPAEKRKAIASLPAYPWEAWDATGFDGIEIWNQFSDWVEQITPWNVLFRLFFPRRFLKPPSTELLQRWDTLTEKSRVSIIGGVDAHAFQYKLLFCRYTLVPYKVSFQSIRTHVLTETPCSGDPEVDISILIDALKSGNAFVSNFRVGDARGFRYWAENAKKRLDMGDEQKWEKHTRLCIHLPSPGHVHILCSGKNLWSFFGTDIDIQTEHPGVYRVEVVKKDSAWIYSNPIYLRP